MSARAHRPQSVCIDLEAKGHTFSYRLEIDHDRRGRARIEREEVSVKDQALYQYDGEHVALMSPDASEGGGYLYENRHSPLSTLPRDVSPEMSSFLEEIRKLWVIRPVPQLMAATSRADVQWLEPNLSNFADWLRDLIQDDPQIADRIGRNLREVLEGFSGFSFEPIGPGSKQARTLLVRFRAGRRAPMGSSGIALDELSDGQRVLVALYTLLHYVVGRGYTLCIDEPENFLALPEIQPWLDEVRDMAVRSSAQVFLVSHHPRVVDLLASSHGYWFDRRGTGPVRASRVQVTDGGVSVSTLVERGWLNG